MPLPKKISPNPLLTSTIEIRFESDLTSESVLTKFFPLFGAQYPNLKDANNLPKGFKIENSPLAFFADYIFSNDSYSVSVGRNVVAFENVGEYKLWPNYFQEIRNNLNLLEATNIVKSISRVGVRYASFFEGKNSVTKTLKQNIGIEFNEYEEHLQVYNSNFKKENINLFLQIVPNASVQRPVPSSGTAAPVTLNASLPIQNRILSGFLIDIDASSDGLGLVNVGAKLFEIIDKLHSEEKEFFFSLLHPEFLKGLKPEY